MPYYVYLLQCADGSIYTGITTDLNRRLKQHQDKKGGAYTKSHGAVAIVYNERCQKRSEALRREAEIKRWRRTRKLELIGLGELV